MARRRQRESLGQRVEQLVAQGEEEEAFRLLIAYSWIPRGSGHQRYYPTGLRLYAEVDDARQILVSDSGRYWAWALPPSYVLEMQELRKQLEETNLPELAYFIFSCEYVSWWLSHNEADGRLGPGADVSFELWDMSKTLKIAFEVFAARVGIDVQDKGAWRQRYREELAKYEEYLAQEWAKVYRVGSVFCLTRNEDRFFLEVLATYQTRAVIPHQMVFVRERGSGLFTIVDERDIHAITLTSEEPMYLGDPLFLRSGSVEGRFPDVIKDGADIRQGGTVFEYRGGEDDPRNGVYETFYVFFHPNPEERDAEVVIARGLNRPVVAEFTGTDLPKIHILNQPSKFVEKGDGWTFTPSLDLTDELEKRE